MKYKLSAMIRLTHKITSLLILFTLTIAKGQSDNDKFRWLEEIDGKKQMSWVEDHNKKTLDYLTSVKG